MIIEINKIKLDEIKTILELCDSNFVPLLSSRVNLDEYSQKIFENAETLSLRVDKKIVGMLAIYCNNKINAQAYITAICVLQNYWGNGYGEKLLTEALKIAENTSMKQIRLEVERRNTKAIKLYEKFGFAHETENKYFSIMVKNV